MFQIINLQRRNRSRTRTVSGRKRPRHVECIWLDCSVHLAGLHSCFVRGISLGNTVPQALATPRWTKAPKLFLLSLSHILWIPFQLSFSTKPLLSFYPPRPDELEQNSCKGKDSTPTAILELSEHPSEGFPSFPDPVLFLCNAFNKQVFGHTAVA